MITGSIPLCHNTTSPNQTPTLFHYDPYMTAERVLFEVDNKIYHVRPEYHHGISIHAHDKMKQHGYSQFHEDQQETIPVNKRKERTGCDIQYLQETFPNIASSLKTIHTRLLLSSQKVKPQELSDTEWRDFQKRHQSIIHCECCQLDSKLKLIRKLNGNLNAELIIENKEIAEKLPHIVNCVMRQTQHVEASFRFMKFISEDLNNTATVLYNQKLEKFLVKHVCTMRNGEQNYADTFRTLVSVRQSSIDGSLLTAIGKDLDILPVVTGTKLISVITNQPNQNGVSFFYMTSFIENSINLYTVRIFLNTPEWVLYTRRIARFLARLHTLNDDITFFQNKHRDRDIPTLTTSRLHADPHLKNWLLREPPSRNSTLYLIDWENYRMDSPVETGKNKCHCMFAMSDIRMILSKLSSEDSKNAFKTAYLEELDLHLHFSPEENKTIKSLCETAFSEY